MRKECAMSINVTLSQVLTEKIVKRPICRHLFPFRKWSLPFLTVDATIENQAFSPESRV